jgi:copper chaperone CopZ
MATATLRVTGMTCKHCVMTVKQALEAVEGVEQAKVDLDAGSAVVEYDDGRTEPTVLAGVVSEEGYPATVG